MFTCTKLSKGESLLSFCYNNNFYSHWWDSACDSKGLQAHAVRRDELQHLLTDWVPLWSHRRVTLGSCTRMKKTPFTYLNQTLLHKLFLFLISFVLLLSFFPPPFFTLLLMSLLHFGAMGCQCSSFRMMSSCLSQHWWVNLSGEERGCPWRGWMMHPTKSKLRAEGCFPGWQHREQQHAQGTVLPTLALIWVAFI